MAEWWYCIASFNIFWINADKYLWYHIKKKENINCELHMDVSQIDVLLIMICVVFDDVFKMLVQLIQKMSLVVRPTLNYP